LRELTFTPFTVINAFARLQSNHSARFEVGTAPDRKAFSIMDSKAKERAELLFHKRTPWRHIAELKAPK
jgi:hypothetical protein